MQQKPSFSQRNLPNSVLRPKHELLRQRGRLERLRRRPADGIPRPAGVGASLFGGASDLDARPRVFPKLISDAVAFRTWPASLKARPCWRRQSMWHRSNGTNGTGSSPIKPNQTKTNL